MVGKQISGARFYYGRSFLMDNEAPDMSSGVVEVAQAVERLAAVRIGRGLPFLAVIAVYGLTQTVRLGVDSGDYLVVLVGALLSAGCMVAYGAEAVRRVVDKVNPWSGAIYAGSFIPYLFGGYLIVTRALQLLRSSGQMSGGALLATLLLISAAAFSVRAQWKLTEVHLLAREMSGLVNLGSP